MDGKTVGEFITENITVYNKLIASGFIPLKMKSYYRIYLKYNELDHIVKKQDRVTEVAEEFSVSEETVYRALRCMRAEI